MTRFFESLIAHNKAYKDKLMDVIVRITADSKN